MGNFIGTKSHASYPSNKVKYTGTTLIWKAWNKQDTKIAPCI